MANVTPASLVPETTLQRLAPRREGFWLVTGQQADHFTLAYVMDGGTHALTYHIYPCNTAEEVFDVCGHLMYDWTGARDVIPARFSYNRSIAVPGTQPLELALRPREQDTQEPSRVVQNLVGTNLNLNPIQGQVAMVQQPGMATQLHDQMGSGQGGAPQGTQYQLANSADGNGNIDWSMTNVLFNDADPMVNGETDNPLAPLSRNTAFTSVLGEYSSTAGDMSLLDSDTQMQLEWNLFTNN